METRFVTVETEIRAGEKVVRRALEERKRCWKYGEAARNMFLYVTVRSDRPRLGKLKRLTMPIA